MRQFRALSPGPAAMSRPARGRSLRLIAALGALAWQAAASAALPAVCPDDLPAVLDIVNAVRAAGAQCGQRGAFPPAPPVRWNDTLAALAADHARWLVELGDLSHTGPAGEDLAKRADRVGYLYRSLGENLAHGQRTPQAAVVGWLRSDTHCATLFGPQYTEAGVSCRPARDGRPLWVLELGRPRAMPAYVPTAAPLPTR
jgi:uncharacterized protein YkwD